MSNEQPPRGALRRELSTGRLEALSDGVYAIAITLLVLDIAVPAHAGDHLLRSLAHQWPAYLAYVVSFSTIGASWLGHNVITEYLDRADPTFIRLNLLLLLAFVAFLPFPTRLFADYIGEDQPERVAATIYGIFLLLSSTLLWVLWRYAVRANLVRPDLADEEVQLLTQRLTPGLGGYVVLIVAGLFVPVIAVGGYLAIALFYIIPFRRFGRIRLFRRPRRPVRQAGTDHQGEGS
jgi:TMEM175 potassium channel family protein